jgi:NADH-quinone oxidoreductase subunit I
VPPGAGIDNVEKAPQAFDIDMLRCIYCGLCEEVCPEEAIFLQNQYSMSGYSRAEMVNHKDRLYEMGGTLPDKHFKWEVKKAAEEGPAGTTEGTTMEQTAFLLPRPPSRSPAPSAWC